MKKIILVVAIALSIVGGAVGVSMVVEGVVPAAKACTGVGC